jgi:acetyl esterase/lipase
MPRAYDPELAPDVLPFSAPDLTDPATTRAFYIDAAASLPQPEVPEGLDVRDTLVPGRDGSPDVPVRVYSPTGVTEPLPAFLYIHGGNFVLGNLEMSHAALLKLAGEIEAVIVSVDYRLAPEDPFPAGLEDCYATLRWIADNASDLHVDPARIAIGGDSAGGTITAALALLSRDRKGPAILFQYLGIPALDDRLETDSVRDLDDVPIVDRAILELTWRHYLSGPTTVDGKEGIHYAAPARATDLGELPPAFLAVSEYDPLRDEQLAYAQRLLGASVSVELHLYAGTVHGTFLLPHTKAAKRMNADLVGALRRAFGTA